jgi:hypothetical protein
MEIVIVEITKPEGQNSLVLNSIPPLKNPFEVRKNVETSR